MKVKEYSTLFEIHQVFKDEQTCNDMLVKIRWDDKIISPFDELSKVYKCKGNKFRCKNTGKYFNVRTGTIFQDSNIPLQKWIFASFLFSSHKKGISSYQLARDLGIAQKSAWFMLSRLRFAASQNTFFKPFTGVIEADEMYVGGKHMHKHKWERDFLVSQGTGHIAKTPVMGLLERPNNIYLQQMPGNKVTGAQLKPIIIEKVVPGAILITDGFGGYAGLHKHYKHSIINHDANEFGRGAFHTNSIEGAFGLYRRMIYGIYHHTSIKHGQAYLNEFTFRYNTRKQTEKERFIIFLDRANQGSLKWNDLIKKEAKNP